MCEVARIAIFQAFSCRGIKSNNLKVLITMNNFFSQRFVAAVRQQRPNVFINAHAIEDLSAVLIQDWQERIAARQFTPEAFEAELAQRIIKDGKIIDFGAEKASVQEVLTHIRGARFENGASIGQFLNAWAIKQQFQPPKKAGLGQDVVSLSDAAQSTLDAAQRANSAKTGVNDPDLCG